MTSENTARAPAPPAECLRDAPVTAYCPNGHTDCRLRVKVGVSAVQLGLWCQTCRLWYSITAKASVIKLKECHRCQTGFPS
jgi:hypothetical protein